MYLILINNYIELFREHSYIIETRFIRQRRMSDKSRQVERANLIKCSCECVCVCMCKCMCLLPEDVLYTHIGVLYYLDCRYCVFVNNLRLNFKNYFALTLITLFYCFIIFNCIKRFVFD